MSEYPQRLIAQGVPHDVFPVLHDALNRMGYPIAWSGKGTESRTIYQTDERRTGEGDAERREEVKAVQIMPADGWYATYRDKYPHPLLAWALKEDGVVVGLVVASDGHPVYADLLPWFEGYALEEELPK